MNINQMDFKIKDLFLQTWNIKTPIALNSPGNIIYKNIEAYENRKLVHCNDDLSHISRFGIARAGGKVIKEIKLVAHRDRWVIVVYTC